MTTIQRDEEQPQSELNKRFVEFLRQRVKPDSINHFAIIVYYSDDIEEFFLTELNKRSAEAVKNFKNAAIKQARRYTADGLVADGLDPWAIPVKELEVLA